MVLFRISGLSGCGGFRSVELKDFGGLGVWTSFFGFGVVGCRSLGLRVRGFRVLTK